MRSRIAIAAAVLLALAAAWLIAALTLGGGDGRGRSLGERGLRARPGRGARDVYRLPWSRRPERGLGRGPGRRRWRDLGARAPGGRSFRARVLV
jgi:hypothetical protein